MMRVLLGGKMQGKLLKNCMVIHSHQKVEAIPMLRQKVWAKLKKFWGKGEILPSTRGVNLLTKILIGVELRPPQNFLNFVDSLKFLPRMMTKSKITSILVLCKRFISLRQEPLKLA